MLQILHVPYPNPAHWATKLFHMPSSHELDEPTGGPVVRDENMKFVGRILTAVQDHTGLT